jgi:hypothetical protein
MLNWLNTNAGAVQAVCTLVLVGVTWYYVRLTKLIAETSHRQLSATLQPVLQVAGFTTATGKTYISGVVHYYTMSGTITIRNQGASPLELKQMYLVAEHLGALDTLKDYCEYPIDDHEGRVLMPKEEFVCDYSVVTEVDYDRLDHRAVFSFRVECTDLSGIFLHSFWNHPVHGAQHTSERVVEPAAWDEIKSAPQRIWNWAKRLKSWAKEKWLRRRFLKRIRRAKSTKGSSGGV